MTDRVRRSRAARRACSARSDRQRDALGRPNELGRPDAPGRPDRAHPAGGVLVIGYGSSLRGDDGVGPRVAELVAADPRFAGAVVATRHQLTPELALDMSAAELVVLVDATTEVAAGVVAVRRVEPAERYEWSVAPRPTTSTRVVLIALARELYGASPRRTS